MSKLVLLLPDGTNLDVPLDRERMTIGRRADNEICLPNLAVSGEHAAIVTILDDSFLEDLGSTNGTLVNGAPISKHLLRDGDQIDVGRHILIYCVDENAVPAPDIAARPVRSTLRDQGDRIDAAKPFVKPASPRGGQARRRDRVSRIGAAKPAPAPESRLETTQANAVQPPRPPPRTASLKVLSGPGAGRAFPIYKAQTTIGRAGVQVALIVRTGDSFALRFAEGEHPPRVNGAAPAGAEAVLADGDVIEIVGSRLQFAGVPQLPTQ